MPTKEASSNLFDLFEEPDGLVFCSYKDLGLLCFDGAKLTFVSVVPPPTGNKAAPFFARVSTISFEESPPGLANVNDLIPSENGRYVALIGERCIYVVELSADFWSAHVPFASVWLENLRSEYTQSCEILNVNLVLGKRSHSIRKAVWLCGAQSPGVSPYLLGVLYSNSTVRIYDVHASKSAPVALAGFQRALGYDPDESFKSGDGTHLGLVSEIVSFDFGPTITHDDELYLTVFALDSDGEVYYNVCGFKAESAFDPIGPLFFEAKDESRNSFYFNSSEILFLNHEDRDEVPVFAFCSDQGELFHAVLCQVGSFEKLFEHQTNIYQLTVVDSMQIEDWPVKNMNVVLRNNNDVPGEYFVVSSTEVYLINPLSWIQFLDASTENANPNTSAALPPTEVRHFFKILNATADDTTTITSIAPLRIEDENNDGDASDASLFVVFDSSLRVSANFIRRMGRSALASTARTELQLGTGHRTSSMRPRLNLSSPTLASVPKLSTAGLDQKQRLRAITQAVQQVREQSDQLRSHVAATHQQMEQLVQRSLRLDQIHEQLVDRLLQIFESIHTHKQQLEDLHGQTRKLGDRYCIVSDRVYSKVYTPVEDEDEAAQSLAKTREQSARLLKTAYDLNSRMLDYANKQAAESRPFHASAKAQKFMLSKNTVELRQLSTYIEKLRKDFETLAAN